MLNPGIIGDSRDLVFQLQLECIDPWRNFTIGLA